MDCNTLVDVVYELVGLALYVFDLLGSYVIPSHTFEVNITTDSFSFSASWQKMQLSILFMIKLHMQHVLYNAITNEYTNITSLGN